jgi:hypothetical protein
MKLDGDKLLVDLRLEIINLEDERDHASKMGWFEKAAKCHVNIEGLRKSVQMIKLGDYTIKDDK